MAKAAVKGNGIAWSWRWRSESSTWLSVRHGMQRSDIAKVISADTASGAGRGWEARSIAPGV